MAQDRRSSDASSLHCGRWHLQYLDICLSIWAVDTQARMMKQQEVFRALADPTRRAILKRLQKGALGAGEIGALFDLTGATLSHHFAVLKQADLVRNERRGRHIVYSLNTSVMEDLTRMMLDLIPAVRGRGEGK